MQRKVFAIDSNWYSLAFRIQAPDWASSGARRNAPAPTGHEIEDGRAWLGMQLRPRQPECTHIQTCAHSSARAEHIPDL